MKWSKNGVGSFKPPPSRRINKRSVHRERSNPNYKGTHRSPDISAKRATKDRRGPKGLPIPRGGGEQIKPGNDDNARRDKGIQGEKGDPPSDDDPSSEGSPRSSLTGSSSGDNSTRKKKKKRSRSRKSKKGDSEDPVFERMPLSPKRERIRPANQLKCKQLDKKI